VAGRSRRTMEYGAARKYRLTKRDEISRLFNRGAPARDGVLTVLALPNGLGRSRMVVAASKRQGNAVRRNRVKRHCREAFRLSREQLPSGCDYAMVPRSANLTLDRLRASLVALATRAAAKAQGAEPHQSRAAADG